MTYFDECSECGGAGDIVCPFCDGKLDGCPECDGIGSIECDRCHGVGEIEFEDFDE